MIFIPVAWLYVMLLVSIVVFLVFPEMKMPVFVLFLISLLFIVV